MAKSKKKNDLGPAKTFGERVRAIRKSLKMRQEDIAPGLKISTTHLSEIEKGKSKPCHDFFYNIVKNYNVNLYYLLFGEGEMFGDSVKEIVTDGKKIKTGDKNIDTFLYYFFNSPMVHSYLMYQFRKLYIEEKSGIMKDLENSTDEEKRT
jgi:transcriptional regulator with XRE-family HTH domain